LNPQWLEVVPWGLGKSNHTPVYSEKDEKCHTQ
jgi:hypothetical protein